MSSKALAKVVASSCFPPGWSNLERSSVARSAQSRSADVSGACTYGKVMLSVIVAMTVGAVTRLSCWIWCNQTDASSCSTLYVSKVILPKFTGWNQQ